MAIGESKIPAGRMDRGISDIGILEVARWEAERHDVADEGEIAVTSMIEK